jgi:hypothetical protein
MSKLLVQLLPKSATKYLRIVKVFVDYTKANLYRLGLKKKAYRPYFYRFFPYMSHRVIDEDDKNIRWGLAFSEYLQGVSPPVSLVWAATPMPGNFGDWMSPYIIQKVTGRGIKFVNELYFRKAPHIVSLGSIVSCANKDSVVLGSGINSVKDCISQNANLVSVRGRYTGIAAKHCDLKAKKFVHFIGDAHIYESHEKDLKKQTF